MGSFQDWVIGKRGGRGLNQPRMRDDPPLPLEEHKPFDRRRIIKHELWQAERDLAYTTRWLAETLPEAVANRENFLDWRWDANNRYARALRLAARLKPEAARTQQLTLF